MIFVGRHRASTGATATCLAYSVWLDDKFAFGGGGQLPGVFGGVPAEPGKRTIADQLTVTPHWDGSGNPAILAVREAEHRRMSGTNIVLPTNRWIKIELETVLNTPGMADGAARMWIDGDLIVKDTAITLRQRRERKVERRAGRRELPARAARARNAAPLAFRNRLALARHCLHAAALPNLIPGSPYQHTMRRPALHSPARKGRLTCEMS